MNRLYRYRVGEKILFKDDYGEQRGKIIETYMTVDHGSPCYWVKTAKLPRYLVHDEDVRRVQ